MRITDKFIFFYKENLSQWNMSAIKDPKTGLTFNCNEQYMMWHKAMLFEDQESADKIMKEAHPRDQQARGREVKNYKQELWDRWKFEIVFNATWLKFTQHPALLKQLLEYPRGRVFVEASPVDKVWGIKMGENDPGVDDPANWKGENLLGLAITDTLNGIIQALNFEDNSYHNTIGDSYIKK